MCPTQSPVIFLQQLGRGLRLHEGKSACSVFDFIGQQREEFDFERRYAALINKRGKKLVKEIESGFPTAPPPDTNIDLDRIATERILSTIKRIARGGRKRLLALTKETATADLAHFVEETDCTFEDMYQGTRNFWTRHLRDTGLLPTLEEESSVEKVLLKRIPAFLHVDDRERTSVYTRLLNSNDLCEKNMSSLEVSYARMLIFNVWASNIKESPDSIDAALFQIGKHTDFVSELTQVLDINATASHAQPSLVEAAIGKGALYTHAQYSLGELIAILEERPITETKALPREGVRHFEDVNTDLLLVTMQKYKSVSESTNYHDYPIAEDLFHWQSQSTTPLDSKTGQRFLHHLERGASILLAVRFQKKNSVKLADPYTLLGEVDYVSHRGEETD